MKCLVICPFGTPGSKPRKRTEHVFKYYIEPVTRAEGYEAYSFIESNKPGEINSQILDALHGDDLVIADLTDMNPNVFYELGHRHATGMPFIHIAESTENIPFNVSTFSVVHISEDFNIEKANQALEELRSQIRNIKDGNCDFSNFAIKCHKKASDGYCVAVYKWELKYLPNIVAEWLPLQKTPIQKCIEKYESGGGAPDADGILMNAFAEYTEYKAYQNKRLFGDLYYVINRKTRLLEGWGNFQFAGSPTLAIQIDGTESEEKLTINFSQPERKVKIVQGSEAIIRAFFYTINYSRSRDKTRWVGDLYLPLPDLADPRRQVKLAETKLHPRVAPGSAD